MEDIIKKVLEWALTYGNAVVGVCATLILEVLKRNVIEKIVALTSEVKKVLYPAMAVGISIGMSYLFIVLDKVKELSSLIPDISNPLLCGLGTGIAIALGYSYITKSNPN